MIVVTILLSKFESLRADENSFGIYAGRVTLGSTTEPNSGVVYEYKFTGNWGLAATYDQFTYKNRDDRSTAYIGLITMF